MTQFDTVIRFQMPFSTGPGVKIEEFDMALLPKRSAPFEGSRFSVCVGQTTSSEAHSDLEMWFFARGTAVVTAGSQVVKVGEGEAVWFPSNVQHYVENVGAEDLVVFSIYWGGIPDEQVA